MSDIEDFVDVETAAKILNTSEKNIYTMFERKKFPNSRKFGAGVAIHKDDLKQLINRKVGRPSKIE